MNGKEIKTGETYFFVATDSKARKHLEGTEFTVLEIKHVWRRRNKKSRQVKRFFNEFGEGARAEELEPLADHYDPSDRDIEARNDQAEKIQELNTQESRAALLYLKNKRPMTHYQDDPGTPF